MASIVSVREDEHGFTYVDTGTCPFCGKPGEVTIPPHLSAGFARWDKGRGAKIQSCLPGLSGDDRELLLSGIHGACYDEEYPDTDDIGTPRLLP